MSGERKGRLRKLLGADGEVIKTIKEHAGPGDDLPPGVESVRTIEVDMSKVPDSIAHRMLMAQKLAEMSQLLIMMTLQPHKFQDKTGASIEMGSDEHIKACDVELARVAGAAVFAMAKADETNVIGRMTASGTPASIIAVTKLLFKTGREAMAIVEPDINEPPEPGAPKDQPPN